jgi:hypothetical protein
VDFDAEILKASKKLDLAKLNEERLVAQIQAPEYQTKIPEAVRALNSQKVRPVLLPSLIN